MTLRRPFYTLWFLASALFAQSITIDAGSTTDQYFSGGVVWEDPTINSDTTLRYGPSFSYDVPLMNGFYNVTLRLLEPNKTAAGQRRFTITANGIQSDPLDLFALTGGINVPYSTTLLVMVGNGHLRILFQASIGNAVVSSIEIVPAPIPIGTINIKLYQCAPPLSDVTCSPPAPP